MNSSAPAKSHEAEVGHLRLHHFLGLMTTLAERAIKGGRHKRSGQSIQVGTPDPVTPVHGNGARPVQYPHQGRGPLFFRRYWVNFNVPLASAESLMQMIQSNPNAFSSPKLAVYEKTKGQLGHLQVGDEFFVKITGPWNGPIRTIFVDPTSFSFATLEGHMEAGEIKFLLTSTAPDHYRFEIQSWARSKGEAVNLFYDKLGLAKLMQTEMWTTYCENIVRGFSARQLGMVEVEERSVEFRREFLTAEPEGYSATADERRRNLRQALEANFAP